MHTLCLEQAAGAGRRPWQTTARPLPNRWLLPEMGSHCHVQTPAEEWHLKQGSACVEGTQTQGGSWCSHSTENPKIVGGRFVLRCHPDIHCSFFE